MSAPRRAGDTVAIAGSYQYDATYSGWSPQRFWHQSRFRVAAELLAADSGMVVLDIGCGSGVFADRVGRDPQVAVIGLDANLRAVEFARRQYGRPNLTFERGELDMMSFSDASFDRISLLEVIEHIYENQAQALLEHLKRLLRPGGRLVISTPNAHSAWPVLEWSLDRLGLVAHMQEDQHVALYHRDSLRLMCEKAGFRLLQSKTLFVVSPALAVVSTALAERALAVEARLPGGALLLQSFERI